MPTSASATAPSNDTRFLRCLQAATHATTGRLFPAPDPQALIAVVRATMAEVDAYEDSDDGVPADWVVLDGGHDLDADIVAAWPDEAIPPARALRDVRQIWAGDMVWASDDRRFLEVATTETDDTSEHVTVTYTDGTTVVFHRRDQLPVAARHVDARIWNVEAQMRADRIRVAS